MTIDIIDYTQGQLENMSEARLARVKKAQLRKNRLQRDLAKNLQKEKDRLIENGTFESALYALTEEKLRNACEEEIEVVKSELIAYLASSKDAEGGTGEAPYLVDYSLCYDDRIDIVKDYYLSAYPNALDRAYALRNDQIAIEYLGSYYAPLYEYFLALV